MEIKIRDNAHSWFILPSRLFVTVSKHRTSAVRVDSPNPLFVTPMIAWLQSFVEADHDFRIRNKQRHLLSSKTTDCIWRYFHIWRYNHLSQWIRVHISCFLSLFLTRETSIAQYHHMQNTSSCLRDIQTFFSLVLAYIVGTQMLLGFWLALNRAMYRTFWK